MKKEIIIIENEKIVENRKNIGFLLENWDMLNVKDIMKLYASGGIF